MNDQPYMSLSNVVSEYCLASFNDRRKFFLNYMVHGKWIWMELFQNSIFSVVSKYLAVDFTTTPPSIVIPKGATRIINVSWERADGSLKSLLSDDTINEVPIPVGNECQICGDTNDYGQCVNNITAVTREIVMFEQTFIETIWKKISPAGDLLEVRQSPVPNYDDDGVATVQMITTEKKLCNLEQKSCGCIAKCPNNKDKITHYCGGCFEMVCPTNCNAPLRMKISNGRIWLKGNIPKELIVSFQTNGLCGEDEIMIPTQVETITAMMMGIAWRSSALAPNKTPFEVSQRRIAYDRAVEELDMFLNPIRTEEFLAVQMSLAKWGAVDLSCDSGESPQICL